MINKIAIYARKSKYTDSGESINAQIEKIKSYLGEDGDNFSIFIDEGFSGGNLNRPEFKRLYAAVKRKEFNIVAVYKIDRIARNVVDFFRLFGEFEKYGVDLVSATEDINARTSQGRFMVTMLAGVADMERSNIITRITVSITSYTKICFIIRYIIINFYMIFLFYINIIFTTINTFKISFDIL